MVLVITAKVGPIPEPMLIGSLHKVLTPTEWIALGGLTMFGPVSQTAGWFDEPTPVLTPVHPIFDWMARHRYDSPQSLVATSQTRNNDAQTISNRLFELLPPDRLRSMSRVSRLGRIFKKSDLLTEEPDDEDYVVDDDDEPVYGSKVNPSTPHSVEEIIKMMKIEGSVYHQSRIREVVTNFLLVFQLN